jgi:hypothetical protein
MGAARDSLNKATLSVGFQAKYGVVQSITADGLWALVVDRQNTETRVPMTVQRSKAPRPAVGETWLIDQALGFWTFAAFVSQDALQFSASRYDSSLITVAQAASTPITIAWDIPAGDASPGTIYTLSSTGHGAWGNPVTTLAADIGIDSAVVSGGNSLASATFTAGELFNFEFMARIVFTSVGSSGSYRYFLKLTASSTSFSAQNGYTMLRRNNSVALDTTADHTMELLLAWGSAHGGPTVSSDGSIFQRQGT